jgi:hypothetical protein
MATIEDAKTITLATQGATVITEEELSSSIGMYYQAIIPAVYRTDIIELGLLGTEGNKAVYCRLSNTSGSIDFEKSYISVRIPSDAGDEFLVNGSTTLDLYNNGDTVSMFVDNSHVIVSLNGAIIIDGYIDFELDSSYRFFAEMIVSENQQTYSLSNILFYPTGSIGQPDSITKLTSTSEANRKHLITPNTYRFYADDEVESIQSFEADVMGVYLTFLVKEASSRIRDEAVSTADFYDAIRFGLRDSYSGSYFHFYIQDLQFPDFSSYTIFNNNIELHSSSPTYVKPGMFSIYCDGATIEFIVNEEVVHTINNPPNAKYYLSASSLMSDRPDFIRYHEVGNIEFYPTGSIGSIGPHGPTGSPGATGSQGVIGTPTTIAPLKRITAISKTGFEILLSSNATLAVNDAIEFIAPVGNVPANRVFYVLTKISTDRITIKTSIGGSTAY